MLTPQNSHVQGRRGQQMLLQRLVVGRHSFLSSSSVHPLTQSRLESRGPVWPLVEEKVAAVLGRERD